jgi:hypothetical protein
MSRVQSPASQLQNGVHELIQRRFYASYFAFKYDRIG